MAINHEIKDNILCIQINRPEKRNMLDEEHLNELTRLIASARGESSVRCVFLSGLEGVFCAGEELSEELATAGAGEDSPAQKFMYQLTHLDRPIVACVQGPAVGLGAALLYYCDLVYTSTRGLFSFPYTALGLTPRYGVTLMMLRGGGLHQAAAKLLCSEPINPQEAKSLKLVTDIYEPDEVYAQAWARAERLTKLPQSAVLATLHLLENARNLRLEETYQAEERQFLIASMNPEAQEACKAFMEGRMPDFSKKKA